MYILCYRGLVPIFFNKIQLQQLCGDIFRAIDNGQLLKQHNRKSADLVLNKFY